MLHPRFACVLLLFASSLVLAQSNPIPVLNQLTPVTKTPGSPSFVLTARGSGFAKTAVIQWNGVALPTTVVSDDLAHAIVSAADIKAPETASVTVVNPSPGGGASNVVFLPVRWPFPSASLSSQKINGIGTDVGVVGDFNNDGIPDIAVGDAKGNVNVYLSNGNGTFKAPITSSTTFTPDPEGLFSMMAGDFNGDGKLDLFITGPGCPAYYYCDQILLGNGDGSFTQAPYNGDAGRSHVAALGDFNGDGKLDIVLAVDNAYPYGYVFLGNGDGTYRLGSSLPIELSPTQAAVADFNGDGILDLALTTGDGNYPGVYVCLGKGDGSFPTCVNYGATANGGSTVNGFNVAAADVNGDGILDLVTDGVSVLLGKGDGTFTVNGGVQILSAGGAPLIGDFNGDGKLDVAVSTAVPVQDVPGPIDLLLGNGDGTFQQPIQFPENGDSAYDLAFGVGDFNNDGKLDIATVGQEEVLVGGTKVIGQDLAIYFQINLGASPTTVSFGNQAVGTKSAPQTVKVTNLGWAAVTFRQIHTDKPYYQETNNCGSTIAAHGSCDVLVTFKPSTKGSDPGNLYIGFDYPVGTPLVVPLSGTGQ